MTNGTALLNPGRSFNPLNRGAGGLRDRRLTVVEFNPSDQPATRGFIGAQDAMQEVAGTEQAFTDADIAAQERDLNSIGAAILNVQNEADFNRALADVERRRGLPAGSLGQRFQFSDLPAIRAELEGAGNILKARRARSGLGGFGTQAQAGKFRQLVASGVPEQQARLMAAGVSADELDFVPTTGRLTTRPLAPVSPRVAPTQPVAVAQASPQSAAAGAPAITAPPRRVATPAQRRRLAKELTPGEEKLDQDFVAKDMRPFDAAGGFADVQKQLNQLEDVAKRLESGEEELTGPLTNVVQRIPILGPAVASGAIDAREAVEEVAQRNLRAILGGQFAQREGEQLISRAFNPALDERQNARRLRRLILQMKTAAQQKAAAIQYFKDNGTLRGFQGKLPSFNDFDVGNDGPNEPFRGFRPSPGFKTPTNQAVQVLRADASDANMQAFNNDFGPGAAEEILGVQ